MKDHKGARRCGGCGLTKDLTEYYKNKGTPDGYAWNCKLCSAFYSKTARIGKYGITKKQFDLLFKTQDGRCAICQNIFGVENPPVIDHDHTCCPPTSGYNSVLSTRCGKCIRGLLCRSCNVGLGMFKDDHHRLQAAIRYVQTIEFLDFSDEAHLEEIEISYMI